MAKRSIDKEFLLTDDSVNVYGFRLLTSGFQIELFKQNPIGYRMHDRDGGVVVRWENLRIDGDKVFGKPCINLSNPIGEQTANEVEDGFLNGASCGSIKVLEYSNEPALMIEGQTGPTITKWYPMEIALVDAPGNENALAQSESMKLFDKDDQAINLADFVHSALKNLSLSPLQSNPTLDLNPNNMSFKNSVITVCNLSDTTDDAAALLHIQDLANKAKKVDELTKENGTLKNAKDNAEQALKDLKAETVKKEVEDLLAKGLAEKKTTVEYNKVLAEKYADDPKGLKDLFTVMPAYQSVVEDLSTKQKEGAEKYKGKTYDELDKSGELPDLKANHNDLYRELFKTRFGKYPNK